MAKKQPTQRTLEECRRRGWRAGVVERFNSHTKRRHDLFGFIDVVALTDKDEIVGIQATSGDNVSSRVKKIKEECSEQAMDWLRGQARIEVWGWKQYAQPVDRKYWRVRVVEVTEETLTERCHEDDTIFASDGAERCPKCKHPVAVRHESWETEESHLAKWFDVVTQATAEPWPQAFTEIDLNKAKAELLAALSEVAE